MEDIKSCDNSACLEKFKNLQKEIEDLKKDMEKTEVRMVENERKVDKIGTDLQVKLGQLEVKFDMNSKATSEKLDEFTREIKEMNARTEKKMDDYIKALMEIKGKEDSFTSLKKKIGSKVIEYGIIVAIIIGILLGIKPFF
jgi:predicted  nucleic acid-binding Zn-ribbon protein